MKRWIRKDLELQWRERGQPLYPIFKEIADKYLISPALLVALASRETGIKNIKGDFRDGKYHGYGLLQIDIGTDSKFAASWAPSKVKESIERGAQILIAKKKFLDSHQVFNPRAFIAAYNTGEGNVLRSVKRGKDPDTTTTGGDYSLDVIERQKVFEELISEGTLDIGPR